MAMIDGKLFLPRCKWSKEYRVLKEDAVGVKVFNDSTRRNVVHYSIDDTIEYPVYDSKNPNGLYSKAFWERKGRGIKDNATGILMWRAYNQYYIVPFYSYEDTYKLALNELKCVRVSIPVRSCIFDIYTKACESKDINPKEQIFSILDSFFNNHRVFPRVYDILSFDDEINTGSKQDNTVLLSPIKKVGVSFNPTVYQRAMAICNDYDITIQTLLRCLIEDYVRSEISILAKKGGDKN